jgi:hypothetical protein
MFTYQTHFSLYICTRQRLYLYTVSVTLPSVAQTAQPWVVSWSAEIPVLFWDVFAFLISINTGVSWGKGEEGGKCPPPPIFFQPRNIFGYWTELWQIRNRQKKENEKLAFHGTNFRLFQTSFLCKIKFIIPMVRFAPSVLLAKLRLWVSHDAISVTKQFPDCQVYQPLQWRQKPRRWRVSTRRPTISCNLQERGEKSSNKAGKEPTSFICTEVLNMKVSDTLMPTKIFSCRYVHGTEVAEGSNQTST